MEPVTTQLLVPALAEPGLVLPRFELVVEEGADAGQAQRFAQQTVQLGTARSNDFILSDATVSRFHARIDSREMGLVLRDLNSTNATRANGCRIREAILENDVELRLGNSLVRFRPLEETETVALQSEQRLGALIGGSVKMRHLFGLLRKVADSDLPVIVEGETGTGKELVAREIHNHSPRADKPFETLDCASIPENLIQSELFGHVRGAFTGADRDREGIFERAHGGTVFLDEIGDLRRDLQPQLLRILETGQLRRVGGNRPVKVDVRVVCATLMPLRRLVNQSEFREDLYYRLAGLHLEVPPLRERREDITLLAEHFLAEEGASDVGLSTFQRQALLRRPWAGNVRELRNVIRRAAIMGLDHLADHRETVSPAPASAPEFILQPMKDARESFERRYLEQLMARFPGEFDAAAEAADLHPKSLARLLRRLGVAKA